MKSLIFLVLIFPIHASLPKTYRSLVANEFGSVSPNLKRRHSLEKVIRELRGGVVKATLPADESGEESEEISKKKNVFQMAKSSFTSLQPVTRVFLSLVLMCNVVEVACSPFLDAKEFFVANYSRTLLNLELWRPLTSAFYLGPISMHWATNLYFLITYGSHLEAVNGTAEQVIFLLVAFLGVSTLGALIGLPVVSTCLISAMIYSSSRIDPLATIPFQFGLQIPRWLLPYALAVVDFLQAGSPIAAVPHVVGILAGHFYSFNRITVPLMGGGDWLKAPNWLKRRLDGEAPPNYMEEPEKKK